MLERNSPDRAPGVTRVPHCWIAITFAARSVARIGGGGRLTPKSTCLPDTTTFRHNKIEFFIYFFDQYQAIMFNHISIPVMTNLIQNSLWYNGQISNAELVVGNRTFGVIQRYSELFPGIRVFRHGNNLRLYFGAGMPFTCINMLEVVALIHSASSAKCSVCAKTFVHTRMVASDICEDCNAWVMQTVPSPDLSSDCCICLEDYGLCGNAIRDLPVYFDCKLHYSHFRCVVHFHSDKYACPMRCPLPDDCDDDTESYIYE